jgi:Mrp family chromosome partitioning ATPase
MTPARVLQLVGQEEAKLIERVFLATPPEKIVAFTAPERHSGCSWMVSRIAQRLAARTQATVCAVDANFYWPALHTFFAIPNQHGLLDAAGRQQPLKEVAQRIGDSNLWVVPAGSAAESFDARPAIESLKQSMEDLARTFEYILVDTPAVSASPGPNSTARLGRSAVLILAANSTKRDAALTAKMSLEAAEIPILGVVLNRRRFPIPDEIFQYL